MASLHFDGDYIGQMLLVLRDDNVREVVDLVLGRYAIRTPVADREVFAEMINIYAASLVTDLLGHGLTESITPPDATVAPRAHVPVGDEVLTIRMKSEHGITFMFCYFLHTREDQHV